MAARILVIDDSVVALQVLQQGLTAAGMAASTASDLASLDARLAEGTFDAVLVDVNMPEMYGDDVVEFLRVGRKLKSKLLLYSDLPEEELSKKAKGSGAHGFICKSKGLEAVLAELSRVLAPVAERKKRVLVVDDSEMTAELLKSELTSKGFDVTTADTADKATKIILKKATRPDLVLLDVRMPNVNGEQFCRFIKSNSLFAGIKVLLCSGENVEELQRICREAGADGFLTKDAVLSKVLGSL